MSASNCKPHTLDSFQYELAQAAGLLLMLDYDGTLAPFHACREMAVQDQTIAEHLDRLQQIPCVRVVIVSGRQLDDLLPLLRGKIKPELYGSHGLEFLDTLGCRYLQQQPQRTAELLEKEFIWCRDHLPSDRYEVKPFGVAVHWRGLQKEDIQSISTLMHQHWGHYDESSALRVTPFNGGLELRPRGIGKDDVVRRELAKVPEKYAIAYVGDDWTDEDAFAALGERGFKILIRYEERSTMADYVLDSYQELPSLLNMMVQALQRHAKG